jgi:hypothetical protein
MISVFALACVISRVSASIEAKGPDEAAQEIEIAKVFAGRVRAVVRSNVRRVDNNDDESVKAIAEGAYERGGYGWDVL